MLDDLTPSVEEACAAAQTFLAADDAKRAEVVHQLRQNLRLSRTVRGLNRLLQHPDHGSLGRSALKSLGLEMAG